MANGFLVNLTSLDDAAEGVSATIALFAHQKVTSIPLDPDAIGDGQLVGCVSDFLARWEQGVSNLSQDGQQISARLTACARNYRTADNEAKNAANGVLQGVGNDPGTVTV
jgi:hypothetical protein